MTTYLIDKGFVIDSAFTPTEGLELKSTKFYLPRNINRKAFIHIYKDSIRFYVEDDVTPIVLLEYYQDRYTVRYDNDNGDYYKFHKKCLKKIRKIKAKKVNDLEATKENYELMLALTSVFEAKAYKEANIAIAEANIALVEDGDLSKVHNIRVNDVTFGDNLVTAHYSSGDSRSFTIDQLIKD
jgi:hypothetical protein